MALPAVTALAKHFPETQIDIWVGRHSRDVFSNQLQVSKVFEIPDRLTFQDVPSIARRLRQEDYDVTVNLDRSRWLKLAVWGSRPSQTVSLQVEDDSLRHESDIYLDAVGQIGATVSNSTPKLCFTESERRLASEVAGEMAGEFVAVHPGGAVNPGSTMASKRWPAQGYTEILKWANQRGYGAVLTGGKGDEATCEQVISLSGVNRTMNLAGKLSLMESAAVIELAALYVGPDTGVSHLAAATGTPTVAIFGPTNPLRYRPKGKSVELLAPADSFKLDDIDLRREQHMGASVSTEKITSESVIEAAERLLNQVPRNST